MEDLPAIDQVGNQLFDNKIKIDRAKEFLSDPRHHLVVAYYEDSIIGIASGLHYVHPDKNAALFVNEVGVLDAYQNKGIGRTMVKYLCQHGKELGCEEAWVATESSNLAARKAFVAAGGIEDKEPVVLIEFDLNQL